MLGLTRTNLCFFTISTVIAAACGDDATTTDAGTELDGALDAGGDAGAGTMVYAFPSRFASNEDSVNHTGQTARQQLFLRLKAEYERISNVVLNGTANQIDGLCEGGDCESGALAVSGLLDAIYNGEQLTGVEIPTQVGAPDSLCDPSNDGSLTHDDLGATTRIQNKLAGNDAVTDHKDWDNGGFEGFGANPELVDEAGVAVSDISSPEKLLQAFFSTFHHACAQCLENSENCPPKGTPLYTTPGGLDLQQLSEKLLHTGVSFSQATDDYLDDATPDKGLLTDNATERLDDGVGQRDTALGHVWDEAFGYFGGAINTLDYADQDIRGEGSDTSPYRFGYFDYNSNSCIDLKSEFNLGVAVNAAKRDLGSSTGTDFTTTLFTAFWAGRDLIHSTQTNLSPGQLAGLAVHRDTIVNTWESVIAATAVHYINDVTADLNKCGMTDSASPAENFNATDLAKHWSELKGFALGFQFNPRSPWNQEAHDFVELHRLIGNAPALCSGAGQDQVPSGYLTDLTMARTAIQSAYGFSAQDVEGW